ncbi:MAG: RNA polymerase sigma factor WhiG [Actinobacteria bacterium]|nr:RNA polymerase sigma factor WhiG [Actinomycetota bacterium]
MEQDSEILKLWKDYKVNKNQEAREKLILQYSPLVKYVAGKLGSFLPHSVDQADLISYGILGLIDAIEKFDLSREVKFETYAITRIRGAIIDELRSLDWVPRSVRSRARELENAYMSLENEFKRAPTDTELASRMNISLEELQQSLADINRTAIVALDEPWVVGDKGDTISLMDTIESDKAEEPLAVFEYEETKISLEKAIKELPEKEKMVIVLYYFEGLTLKEIGSILNVTESRVSQMHTKAVFHLKNKMRKLEGLEVKT